MTTTNIITVADLAKSLKKKPRDVRRALRKMKNVPYVKGEKRWAFTPANARKVVTAIKAR